MPVINRNKNLAAEFLERKLKGLIKCVTKQTSIGILTLKVVLNSEQHPRIT